MTVDFRVRGGTRNIQVRRRNDIHSAVMDCELKRNDRDLLSAIWNRRIKTGKVWRKGEIFTSCSSAKLLRSNVYYCSVLILA
jgi:hypothetical protein